MDGRSLQAAPVRREVRLGRREEAAVVAPPEGGRERRAWRLRANKESSLGREDESLYRFGPRPDLVFGRAGSPRGHLTTVQDADVVLAEESELAAVKKFVRLPPGTSSRTSDLAFVAGPERASRSPSTAAVAAVTTSYRSNGDSLVLDPHRRGCAAREGLEQRGRLCSARKRSRRRSLHLGGTGSTTTVASAAG